MAVAAAAVVAVLLAVANRYGWHRDEVYFLASGKQLAWGYIDQPPFTPAVARLAHELAPGNLRALRLLPALTSGLTVLLGGLIAHELGANRRGQVFGSLAIATGGFVLGVGHLLSTAATDLCAWFALLWLFTRLLRTGDTRLWVAFGGVAGLALLNKDLVPLLAISLLVGLVVDRRWDILRSPWLAAGIALAGLIALPNLLWQADHGWPQADMADALAERLAGENRGTLLPAQLLFNGPFLIPALWRGARWLRHHPTVRPLLWAWPAGLALTFATAGRPYYVLPLTTVVAIAGIVAATQTDAGPSRRLPAVIAANGIGVLLLGLPTLPLSALDTVPVAEVNEATVETIGWPELVDQVAGVVDDLPPADREHLVLLTGSYGEAGALDLFGPEHALPRATSPQNSYPDLHWPTDDDATVVAVRFDRGYLDRYFAACEEVGRVDNGLDIDNEVQGTPIFVCHGLRGTWAGLKDRMRYLS
jgi:4-amino-4-deoxy-L-arabinose transferase-like glycosyltransferase